MYSVFLLLVAAAGAGVALRGLLAWQRSRSTLLLFCLAGLVAVVLETLFAGLGCWVGAGRQLRDLYALPILVATFAWPLSLFTLATLSRRLGFAWARIDWGHGAVCLIAVALLLYSLPNVLKLRLLYPACWQDVLWYLRAVPAALACPGETLPLTAAEPPLVLAAVLVAYFGLGAGLWRQQRWPWLLIPMATGMVCMLMPAGWGPVPWYLGLTLCFSAIAGETVRHGALLAQPPAEPS